MIKFLSGWIEGIAVSVIVASVFEMLLPKGNLKKYVKVVLGMYIVFSIISPFVDSNALYNIDIVNEIENYTENITSSNYKKKQNNIENETEKMYLEAFEKQLIAKVEAEGYDVLSYNVDAIFSAKNEDAGIKKIDLTIAKKKEKNVKTVEIESVKIDVNRNSIFSSNSEKITQIEIRKLKQILSDYFEVDKNIIDIEN